MSKVVSYNGLEPKAVQPELSLEAIALMQRQLDILEKTLELTWLVQEGTSIKVVPRETKAEAPWSKCCYCGEAIANNDNTVLRSQHGYCHHDCWDKKQGSEARKAGDNEP